MIYLDNAATTKPSKSVIEAVCGGLAQFGNPSSLHHIGVEAELLLNNSREIISAELGANADEIFFTSCATESSNTVIFGAARAYGKRRKKIITTTIEHPSVLQPLEQLEKDGFEVVRISPNECGKINPNDIISQVDENTLLVSCMLVNNETGYILPVDKVFSAVKRKNPDTLTHCDCVQGFMKIPVKVKKLGADMISLSGHKIHGPKGIGVLYVKKGRRVLPLIYGGGQEKNFRSGTECVPLICGFAQAVKELSPTIDERYSHALMLKKTLLDCLAGEHEIHINSRDDCSPYVISIAVEKIKSEIMLHFLESKGIYVSSGSACSKGKKSSVLAQLGIAEMYLDSTIRISPSCENTAENMKKLALEILNGRDNLAKIK